MNAKDCNAAGCRIRLLVGTVAALIASLIVPGSGPVLVQADQTHRWDFTSRLDYDYDPTQIEIDETPPGWARLALQADDRQHATLSNYWAGASSTNVAYGPAASLTLSKATSAQYYPQGSFTSRVLQSPTGWKYFAHRTANLNIRKMATGIYGYYPMDNDQWIDLITGIKGWTTGSPTFTTEAKKGSHAGRFKGAATQDRVQLYPSNLDGKSAFTIAFWVKLLAYDEWAGLVFSRNDVRNIHIGFMLWSSGSDLVVFRLQQSPSLNTSISAKIKVNQWYFMTATWDGGGDGLVRVYFNGRLVGTSGVVIKGALTQAAAFEAGASISGEGTFTKYFMNGMLDEVTFWTRALSAKEIEQLYNDYSLFYPVRFQLRSAPSPEELTTRNFVGPDGTSSSYYYGQTDPLVESADFSLTNRYAQYRAYLYSSSDQRSAPVIQAVGVFSGEGWADVDDTFSDFRLGEFTSNTTNSLVTAVRGYLGLAKALNGGYYTNGVFVSRVFDSGMGPVTWDRIEWISAGEELDVFVSGLLGLYHCRNTWADATGQHSGNPSLGVTYSDLGKLGGKSAVFNGISAYVDGFGFGTIQSIEFWIQNDHRDNPVLTIDTGTSIRIQNHCITPVGFGAASPTIYVNGSSASTRLIPGWNHVALVWKSPVNAGAFTVGRVGSEYMEGMFDEMAVYGRALPSSEVREHYERGRRRIAGLIRFQARASDDPTFAGVPFVGPGGNPTSYYLGDSALSSTAGRYFQYRVVLDGDGASTPGVMTVTAFYDGLTKVQVDDTPQEFYDGTFVGGTTVYYGDEMNLFDQTALGPANILRTAYPTLIGLWHLDEDFWGTVRDEVGGGHGVATGSAYPVPEPRVGVRCGWFSGTDGRVVLGSPAVGAFPFSVSIWFRTTSLTRSALISSFVGTGPFFALEVNSDGSGASEGRVAFVIDDTSSGRKVAASTRVSLNDGLWHNVVGIRNNSQILLYVDGTLEAATYIGVSYGDIGGAAPSLAYNGAGVFYSGYIDEVAIFGHALSPGEVGEIAGIGVKAKDVGTFVGETITVRDPTIWQKLIWPIHGTYQNPLVPGLSVIGLWHLDETSGAIARDSSANANHGTVVGLQGAVGRFGRCVRLNGVNNAITVSSPAGLSPSRITVEAWVNMDDVASRTILDRRSGGSGYALYTESDGRLTFWIGTGSGGVTATTPVAVRAGQWVHVAGTFDGRNVDVYVNGQREVRSLLLGSAVLSGGTLTIGSDVGGGGWFAGAIDEVAIHNRALLPGELIDHYTAGVTAVKLQARSWDPGPFGTFVGPGGSNSTYFVNWYGDDTKGDIPPARNLQYKVYFSTEDALYWPACHGVSVEFAGYSIVNPTVSPTEAAGFRFVGNLLSFDHSRTFATNADVRYQISGDFGPTNRWFYWDGARWEPEDPMGPNVYLFQTNPRDVINANIGSFRQQLYEKGDGLFRWRAFLHSEGENTVSIDWIQIRASEGRIVITAPNGTEINEAAWLIGTPYYITWIHAGNVSGTVRVQYSPDGGTTWQTVPGGATVDPTLDRLLWVTPGQATTNALIRILHNSDPSIYDYSDRPFHLAQKYWVIQPNGGEKWYIGETNRIMWGAAQGLGAVSIHYSADGTFADPILIQNFVPSQGGSLTNSYLWVVPTDEPRLPSTTAKVRVATFAGLYGDVSDNFFTLAGASFAYPLRGSALNRGDRYQVQWRSAAAGAQMKLELQAAIGGPWTLIDTVSNVDGLNFYTWTVTNQPTEEARLRLTSLTDPRAVGISEQFTIAALVVISPNGNLDPLLAEKWLAGSTQTVSWVSAGASDKVNIRYSTDGGNTWQLVQADVPNSNVIGFTNTFNWVVAATPSPRVRIRVEDAARPDELWDKSDYDFHIAGVTVTWPSAQGVEWRLGQPGVITWKQNAVGNDCEVEFSYDGGVTYSNILGPGVRLPLIDEAAPPYLPHTPTVRGSVRIRASNPAPFTNVFDTSDFLFTVAGIRIDRPGAGSLFTIGETNQVMFIAAGTHDPDLTADIYYSGDDGATYEMANPIKLNQIFSEAFPGVNFYPWVVEAIRAPSTRARIKIVAGDAVGVSGRFTVRGIRFDTPIKGTLWGPGTRQIRWISAGLAADAAGDLYLSTDGRNPVAFTYKLNSAPVAISAGSFIWDVPQDMEPSTNAVLMLRITQSSAPEDLRYVAYSESFRLQGLQVTSPALGERWALGEERVIRWKASSAGDAVDVWYSPDDGTNYESVAVAQAVPSADGLNSVNWKIETTRMPSSQGRIRVASITGIDDVSDRFELQGILVVRPKSTDIYATTDATNMIRWAAVGDPGPYVLTYLKGGTGPFPIATVTGQTEYNWPIPPAAVGPDVQVVISGSRFSNTSQVFRIVDKPTISIADPAPGVFWRVGRQYLVRWSRGGDMPNNFEVYYTLKPYTQTNQITGTVSFDPENNLYSIPWTVPDRLTQARIYVRHVTMTGVAALSGEFNLAGQFQLLSPNGGEVLYALKPTPVVWRTMGSVPLVDLYYSFTPPYRASSWVKVNSTPIVNEYNNRLEWEQTVYSWAAANIRSPYMRLRVQEATYTNRYDAGTEGPFDDSDSAFLVRYYSIYWDVLDAVTSNRLDNLSVVDSSGWSAAGLSCIPPNQIVRDYPWGKWITQWYREFFYDQVVLNWSSENLALGSPAVWTQRVYMIRSQIEPDYHVLANFTYNATLKTFTIQAWLERSGHILETPKRCVISIYDASGTRIDRLESSTPQPNGIFWLDWDASALSLRTVYYARVEIEYSGFTYSSGITFTLHVPAGEEAILEATTNILAAVGALRTDVQAGMTNLVGLARATTNMLGEVHRGMGDLTNVVLRGVSDMTNAVAVLPALITNLVSIVSDISQDVSAQFSRIITRPTTVPYGSTVSILYKSREGFDTSMVTVQVYNAAHTFLYETKNMSPVLAGIYQQDLTANWGTNSFLVICSDVGGGRDSIILQVVSDQELQLMEMGRTLATLSNRLDEIQQSMSVLTNVNLAAFTNLTRDIGTLTNALAGFDSATLSNVAADIATITNRLGPFDWNDVVTIAQTMVAVTQDVSRLTQLFAAVEWNSLSNIAHDLAVVTTRVGSVDWHDVVSIATNVQKVVDLFAGVNWGSLSNISSDVSVITNALGQMKWQDVLDLVKAVDGLTTNVDFMRVAFQSVNWGSLSNISSDVSVITNALGQMKWQDVLDLVKAVDGLTTNVGGIRTDIAKVDWDKLSTVDWVTLAGVSGDLSVLTNQLRGADWDDVKRLSTDVAGLTNSLLAVNWPAITGMADDVRNISTSVAGVNWNDVTTILSLVRALQDVGPAAAQTQAGVLEIMARVKGLSGVDFSQVDLGAVSRLESALRESGGLEVLGTLEQRLNAVMTTLTRELDRVGAVSSLAAQKAQSARTEAANAIARIGEVRKAIAEGRFEDAVRIIEEMRQSLGAAKGEVETIAQAVAPAGVYESMRRLSTEMEEFAKSKGFKWLKEMEEVPAWGKVMEGAVRGEIDAQTIMALNNNMNEMRATLDFLRKLLDEKRFEPVVEESWFAVE